MNPEKRELLVREEEGASPNYGTLPHKRAIGEYLQKGIVNIDKPAGPTSHQAADWVKRALKARKTGHSGTLDPNVTGVLPVGLNESTKVMQALLHSVKEYVGIMHLHEEVSKKGLESVFKEFTGKIYQRPPIKSAVKRVLRTREIYYLDILEISGKDVLFKVGCEAGTYIRRLVFDIGEVLGAGAHMQQLRRTKTGPFDETSLVTLQDLTDAYHSWKEDNDEKPLRKLVQPMEAALAHLPRIVISDTAVDYLCHGAQLAVPGILKLERGIKKGDLVAVLTQKGEGVLIGWALMKSQQMHTKRKGLAVQTERVLMEAGTYKK